MASARIEVNREVRIGYLVSRLLSGEKVELQDFQDRYGIDARTARGDMHAIDQLRTRRYRGGIKPATILFHDAQRIKNIAPKRDVAYKAARLIDPYASVAMSPGTTVAMTYAEMLSLDISPQIITNSIALTECEPTDNFALHLVGGQFAAGINALVGDSAAKGFKNRTPIREGILGISGITTTADRKGTLYVRDDAEVSVAREMLDAVKEKLIIVADLHKLGHGDPWQVGTIGDLVQKIGRVFLVTNHCEDWERDIEKTEYKIIKRTFDELMDLQKNLTKERFELIAVAGNRIAARPTTKASGVSRSRKLKS